MAQAGYGGRMRLMRGIAAAGIAKKAYDMARRPENQARLRQATAKLNQRRAARRGGGAPSGR